MLKPKWRQIKLLRKPLRANKPRVMPHKPLKQKWLRTPKPLRKLNQD